MDTDQLVFRALTLLLGAALGWVTWTMRDLGKRLRTVETTCSKVPDLATSTEKLGDRVHALEIHDAGETPRSEETRKKLEEIHTDIKGMRGTILEAVQEHERRCRGYHNGVSGRQEVCSG